ncbi:hypothetical protein [Streptomyces sp. NPDC048639]|uniref:hypothetical protein n=1 Tax=Streptomyces sp. NPDC048639 TaxID=3365581 RepID=UPI00371B55B8
MSRTKKLAIAFAITAAVTGGAAAPALADNHSTGGTPVAPQDNHSTVVTPQDNHSTVVTLQDNHSTVVTPQDNHSTVVTP